MTHQWLGNGIRDLDLPNSLSYLWICNAILGHYQIVEAWVAFEERVRFAYGVWPPRANHNDAVVRQSYFSTLSGAYVRLTINCFEAFKEEMKAGAR